MAPSRTITRTAGGSRRPRDSSRPFLFSILRCDRPLDAGARFCLAGADRVSIGRTESLSVTRDAGRLRIGMPDPRMSAAHVELERVLGSWIAQDKGSKNGTFVDGRRIDRARLDDGVLLEVGDTFFLLRDALDGPDHPHLLDGRQLKSAPLGLATLLPSLAIQLERLQLIARSAVTVLLRGESGTGKEALAAAIHGLSGRAGPFQAVNCGAIAPNLVESELFGYRRGAFSGAVADHAGLVRSADGGTLLLDEVGDLAPVAQAALLRVLEEGQVLPVGATKAVRIDLRVVAATNRDLDALVAQGKFRADLLARLSGYVCVLPPLRDRREDFSLVVGSILMSLGADGVTFTPEAARTVLRYSWPLNIRELEKCLASASVLAHGDRVELDDLPLAVRAESPLHQPLADPKRKDELVALLRDHAGNVTAVAQAVGKARSQIQRWLRRYRIDPREYRR